MNTKSSLQDVKSLELKNTTKHSNATIIRLFGGAAAGAAAKTVLSPFERVKVILQTQSISIIRRGQEYKGILDSLYRIPSEQGFLGFWRGNGANILRIAPTSALRFTFNDWFNAYLQPSKWKYPAIANVASGGLAGGSALVILYPLELARVRLTADTSHSKYYKGLVDCMAKTVRDEGYVGLYKGLGASLIEIMPYTAITFGMYNSLKNTAILSDCNSPFLGKSTILSTLCPIVIASMSASILVYPLDTIRRRLILNSSRGFDAKYISMLDCAIKIYREKGIRTFYNGCFINMAKTVPAYLIQFCVYDAIKYVYGINT